MIRPDGSAVRKGEPTLARRWWPGGIAALAIVLPGCALTLPVRTLPAGETRVAVSVAEPLASHFVSDGIPSLTIGVLHGVRDATTVTADLHVAAAVAGIVGIDAGVAHRLGRQDGAVPELTAAGQLALFAGSGAARLFPNVALTGSWLLGTRTIAYTGVTLTGQFIGTPIVLVSPAVGVMRDLSARTALQLEWRLFGANVSTGAGLFEGSASFSGHGEMTLQAGIQWRW